MGIFKPARRIAPFAQLPIIAVGAHLAGCGGGILEVPTGGPDGGVPSTHDAGGDASFHDASGAADGSDEGSSEACVPKTCAQSGANCGPIADGCGGVIRCDDACPPSCKAANDVPGVTNCGPGGRGTESCCASPLVPGGTFYRGYDPASRGYGDKSFPATISAFRLDKYEVTVGRFRRFVDAVDAGWLPSAGAGKHVHLNGGAGLAGVDESDPGWDSNWRTHLETTKDAWDGALGTNAGASWTSAPGAGENKPINTVNWYESYAFCIWDDAFLPSEDEWNFAASAGDEQRVYPWSSPPGSSVIDCSYANYGGQEPFGTPCVAAGVNDVGFESPKGDGKWGQADLVGNVEEWVVDWFYTFQNPCVDCAYLCKSCPFLPTAPARVVRGASKGSTTPAPDEFNSMVVSWRGDTAPNARGDIAGFRCARVP